MHFGISKEMKRNRTKQTGTVLGHGMHLPSGGPLQGGYKRCIVGEVAGRGTPIIRVTDFIIGIVSTATFGCGRLSTCLALVVLQCRMV